MEDAGDRVHQFTDSVQTGVGELQQQPQDLIGESRDREREFRYSK